MAQCKAAHNRLKRTLSNRQSRLHRRLSFSSSAMAFERGSCSLAGKDEALAAGSRCRARSRARGWWRIFQLVSGIGARDYSCGQDRRRQAASFEVLAATRSSRCGALPRRCSRASLCLGLFRRAQLPRARNLGLCERPGSREVDRGAPTGRAAHAVRSEPVAGRLMPFALTTNFFNANVQRVRTLIDVAPSCRARCRG
jgi:hypothetical protein